jgi:hypothetical protein
MPTGLACWQTATFNTNTCHWVVTGTQDPMPTGLACWQTATFNTTTCHWDVTGTQPTQPTATHCWDNYQFNTSLCQWVNMGSQPSAPTGLACYQTATFNNSTCQWDVTGTPIPAPTGSASQSFNASSNPTVANLVATGSNLKWYDDPTAGTVHLSTDVLHDGDHYWATQTVNGCESSARLDVMVTIISTFKLSGYLYYDNNAAKPLKNVPIAINLTSNNSNVTTVTTDNTGYYEVFLSNESYTLVASTNKPWGGVTSADISILSNYLNSISSALIIVNASPARIVAANVNNRQGVTSQDLSLLSQRLNSTVSTFNTGNTIAPDWRFEVPVVVINNADVTRNFWGICAGDMNGSYSNIP